MENRLLGILKDEEDRINILLEKLEEQHKCIVKRNVFELESMVEIIQECNKEIAKVEVERRKLLAGKEIKQVVLESNNEELDLAYRSIRKKLEEITLQKKTNDLLIKQQLSYIKQMLDIINPKRDIKTYNSYGKLGT